MTNLPRTYLVGVAAYPNHRLVGVPNDLALIRRGPEQQSFVPEAIRIFGNEIGTLAGLRHVLTVKC